jgi:hypothetical protein
MWNRLADSFFQNGAPGSGSESTQKSLCWMVEAGTARRTAWSFLFLFSTRRWSCQWGDTVILGVDHCLFWWISPSHAVWRCLPIDNMVLLAVKESIKIDRYLLIEKASYKVWLSMFLQSDHHMPYGTPLQSIRTCDNRRMLLYCFLLASLVLKIQHTTGTEAAVLRWVWIVSYALEIENHVENIVFEL